jgi:2,3-bisphosphoglycerate-dependent phosphoglycerate mutase
MQLILIRHGLPVRVELNDHTTDPPLSEQGRREANLLVGWLAPEQIDAVFSSPLLRASETAMPIALPRALDVIIDEGLSEFDVGVNAYIPYEESDAAAHPQWQRWQEHLTAADDEDSGLRRFRERVRSTIDRIVEGHPGQTVAIACHGGVINAYLTSVLKIAAVIAFEPRYTSISRVIASRSGAVTVKTVNECGHVRTALAASIAPLDITAETHLGTRR